MKNVVIKNHPLKKKQGQFEKGVFAKKDFREGEVVIQYTLKHLTTKTFQELPAFEKNFVHRHVGDRRKPHPSRIFQSLSAIKNSSS